MDFRIGRVLFTCQAPAILIPQRIFKFVFVLLLIRDLPPDGKEMNWIRAPNITKMEIKKLTRRL